MKYLKHIKEIGLTLFLIAFSIFIMIPFLGNYKVSKPILESVISKNKIKSEYFKDIVTNTIVSKTYSSPISISNSINNAVKKANTYHIENKEFSKKIWNKYHNLNYNILKASGIGFVKNNNVLFWWLTFGLGVFGALLYIVPDVHLLGSAGIKNNGIYHNKATNRGWIGWLVFIFLVSFYLLLYFTPDYIVNWTYLVDPISKFLNGNLASQWFLYGFLYCVVMLVMAIRMYIKYRHNKYQILRTTSVLFFQIVFAFLIPEIMVRFQMPWYDFKNAFPLDYDFFFKWNIKELINSGGIGLFILVWGILLTLVIVPVMVYFFGKRWYCSWVCGCGGLAETLGDPYRQLSNKSLKAWQFERWIVHSVLVFALVTTGVTLYTFFTETSSVLGIKTSSIQSVYGLLIGSIFAGVIGTGFYPIFGNRVWCRFGCPLAAYMGIVQRFKSRFRITTNGGQCISCGNCSTYCEQGIDVRAYAQKGENIVRASCVGCGVCAAVCPRGVLKLENGPKDGRINPTEILVGNDIDLIELLNK